MNKLSIFIAALFLTLSTGAFAQESTTGTAESNFSIVENKVKKTEKQLTDEKKNTSAKYWLKRTEIMREVYNAHRQYLQPGSTPEVQAVIFYPNPETKTWEEDGHTYKELTYDMLVITLKDGVVEKFKETKILYENPLPEALRSLEKTQELDLDGKLAKKITEQYEGLKLDFDRLAREQYVEENFKGSYEAFVQVDVINNKKAMEGVEDTTVSTMLFYTGLTASKAGMNDECIAYYEKAIVAGYPEPDIYIYLSQKYRDAEDTLKGIETLERGHERYPDYQGILIELINHYLIGGQQDKALHFLDLAKQKDPTNKSFIFAEATLYEKMGEIDKALEKYKECIEIDEEYYDAFYNIGVMYFNQAVEVYKEADTTKALEAYDALMNKASAILEKSKPYMEKSHELNPTETVPIETLRTIYRRLKMFDESDAMKVKLDALVGQEGAASDEPAM